MNYLILWACFNPQIFTNDPWVFWEAIKLSIPVYPCVPHSYFFASHRHAFKMLMETNNKACIHQKQRKGTSSNGTQGALDKKHCLDLSYPEWINLRIDWFAEYSTPKPSCCSKEALSNVNTMWATKFISKPLEIFSLGKNEAGKIKFNTFLFKSP